MQIKDEFGNEIFYLRTVGRLSLSFILNESIIKEDINSYNCLDSEEEYKKTIKKLADNLIDKYIESLKENK